MGKPARFEIVSARPGADRVVIKDIGPWDGCLTVTNDAERVVAKVQMLGQLTGGRSRLFCIDSEGVKGELLIKDGKFAGFGRYDKDMGDD